MSGIYHRDDIPADLRGYFVRAEIGLEPTPEAYVAEMVAVFREVRRVLRNDGTLWLNLGDSYATDPKGVGGGANTSGLAGGGKYQAEATKGGTPRPKYRQFGLKKKDLIGIPWRVAFALQADGWYLRQDIIWHKPNPMPESTKDRCTKAHEYLFLLSKSAKYYFDSAAMQEPAVGNPSGNTLRKSRPTQQALQRGDQCGSVPRESNGFRNRRSVWTVTTKPFAGHTSPPSRPTSLSRASSPVRRRAGRPRSVRR